MAAVALRDANARHAEVLKQLQEQTDSEAGSDEERAGAAAAAAEEAKRAKELYEAALAQLDAERTKSGALEVRMGARSLAGWGCRRLWQGGGAKRTGWLNVRTRAAGCAAPSNHHSPTCRRCSDFWLLRPGCRQRRRRPRSSCRS